MGEVSLLSICYVLVEIVNDPRPSANGRRLLKIWRKEMPMTDAFSRASTRNSKWIKATPEVLYRAFTDPAALAVWQAPGDMTGSVHCFDYRVGGGYQMSLYYPSSETASPGKTED